MGPSTRSAVLGTYRLPDCEGLDAEASGGDGEDSRGGESFSPAAWVATLSCTSVRHSGVLVARAMS